MGSNRNTFMKEMTLRRSFEAVKDQGMAEGCQQETLLSSPCRHPKLADIAHGRRIPTGKRISDRLQDNFKTSPGNQ